MRVELREGDDVTVHYLASSEKGVIERIEGDGRSVVVVTQSDAVLEFHLMASAHYVTRDRAARLAAS
jgi:hypothetical protein